MVQFAKENARNLRSFYKASKEKNPPWWGIGKHKQHCWHYGNEYGEQWVAKREKDILRIAGLDIEWEEIVLALEQAEAEHARITERRLLLSLAQFLILRT